MSEENTNSQMVPAAATAPAAPAKREVRVVSSEIALYDTAKFEHMNRIAMGMARASLIPEHLAGERKGNDFHPFEFEQVVGNCLLITNQAMRWDVDPFALAAESYVVRGKLGFQGKAIQAIIEDKLRRKLKFRYNSKQGDELAIVVYLEDDQRTISPEEKEKTKALLVSLAEKDDKSALSDLYDEYGIRAVRLSVGQAKTTNDIWRKDPEQKLVYSGSVKWARRYEPGIIMGIKSEDDIEAERTAQIAADIPKAALPPAPNAPAPTRTVTDPAPEVVSTPTPKATRKPASAKKATEPSPAETPAPEQPPQEAPAEPQKPDAEKPADDDKKSPFTLDPEPPKSKGIAADLTAKLAIAGFTAEELLTVAKKYNMAPQAAASLEDIPESEAKKILDDWDNAVGALKQTFKK